MFLWYPVLDLARAPRRTARKKGSGYENGLSPRPHTKALGTRLRETILLLVNNKHEKNMQSHACVGHMRNS